MSEVLANQGAGEGTVRKLWPTETDKFRDHMLRLDKDSRRMRFAHSVSDSFIEDYASRMAEFGSVVYAFIAAGPSGCFRASKMNRCQPFGPLRLMPRSATNRR